MIALFSKYGLLTQTFVSKNAIVFNAILCDFLPPLV